jgi:hypothetical protein
VGGGDTCVKWNGNTDTKNLQNRYFIISLDNQQSYKVL